MLSSRPRLLGQNSPHEKATVGNEIKLSCDADGSFTIAFDPETPRNEVHLLASPVGYAPLSWKWLDIPLGQVTELGAILLEEQGAIIGRIIDARGGIPVEGEWIIIVRRSATDSLSGRQAYVVESKSDARSGEFEIQGVPCGLVELEARLPGMRYIQGPVVMVQPEQTTYVDLMSKEDGLRSEISLVVKCTHFGRVPCKLIQPSLQAVGANNETVGSPRSSPVSCFVFSGLTADNYECKIESVDFVPWVSGTVHPGQVLEVELQGAAAVNLHVFDDASGEQIHDYSITARLNSPDWPSTRYSIIRSDETHDLISGILPIPQSWTISARGYADAVVSDLAVSAGEVRQMSIGMSTGSTIAGHVLQGASLVPFGGARVWLTRVGPDIPDDFGLVEESETAQYEVADEGSGAFRFALLSSGSYLIQACGSPTLCSEIIELSLDRPHREQAIEVRLPEAGYLNGQLIGLTPTVLSRLSLIAVAVDQPGSEDGVVFERSRRQRVATQLAPDGQFRTGLLPAGKVLLSLHMPDWSVPTQGGGSVSSGGGRLELGTVDLRPYSDNHYEFDVSSNCPSFLDLECLVNGEPANGHVAELVQLAASGRHVETRAGGTFSGSRPLRLGPVLPGDYSVLVRSVQESWVWVDPDGVHVTGCEPISLNYSIVISSGIAKVVGTSDHSSMGRTDFVIRVVGRLPVPSIAVTSDEEGNVKLTLPPGRYTVARRAKDPQGVSAAHAEFDWPLAASKHGLVECN